MRDVDVVVVSDHDDAHCLAVSEELELLGASSVTFNLSDLDHVTISANVGALHILDGREWVRITASSTAWWHRIGAVDTTTFDAAESALVRDEGPHVLRGALLAASVRWVDDPNAIERAETKLFQLATAARLGIRIPDSHVLNSPDAARELASNGRIVAKAQSPGIGIAPYTAEVPEEGLDYVASFPVLIQELVEADADLRVVAVGDQAWIWRRPRSAAIDWRADDPGGQEFSQVELPDLSRLAVSLNSALGLSVGVHDWLETADGFVFLEVNPQGQWLFLHGARRDVAPALARHLLTSSGDSAGIWPRAIKRFGQDFLPADKAKANDGVVAPTFATPTWLAEVASQDGALDASRRAHDEAKAGARGAEEKASRLVQIALALLTLALALNAFQLSFVLDHDWPWAFSMIPIVLGLAFLALATFEAVEVDRVGVYHHPAPADLAGTENSTATLLAGEELGRRLARWSSDKKHTDLMQARAWFSRALAALLIGGLLAGVAHAVVSDDSKQPTTPATTSQPLK